MFQVGAACYPTPSSANQIVASAQAGSVVVIGGQSYILSVGSVSDASITYLYSPASGGAQISQTVQNIPPACGLLTAEDAGSIAWTIAAAWIAIYALKFLADYLQQETAGINNDT